MIKYIKYNILVFAFLGCQNLDQPTEPKTLIEEDHMVEILTDIAFIKAAKSSNRKVFETEEINPEAYILKKHGVDSTVFAENNIWYSGQLEKYGAIFNRVKANVEKSRDTYEKLKKEEDSIKKIEDSIKKNKDTLQNKDKLVTPELMVDDEEKAKQKRLTSSLRKE